MLEIVNVICLYSCADFLVLIWTHLDTCQQVMADFAFLPFGGGPRKCVGDQFALMESTVALAMLLQKFDIELRGSPEDVELVTGATIHTKDGLWCKLSRRKSITNLN